MSYVILRWVVLPDALKQNEAKTAPKDLEKK